MPASLPGATLVQNQANPTQGRFVAFDPASGPKGSPFDAKKPNAAAGGAFLADPGNCSTGALSTGIAFDGGTTIGPTAPDSLFDAGFNDDYTPGVTKPDGTAAVDSTLLYIGGGREIANPTPNVPGVPFVLDPFTAGFAIAGAGNGASRDGGAGASFPMKMVTAPAPVSPGVANGAAIEVGFVNRSGITLPGTSSAFGSAAAAQVILG